MQSICRRNCRCRAWHDKPGRADCKSTLHIGAQNAVVLVDRFVRLGPALPAVFPVSQHDRGLKEEVSKAHSSARCPTLGLVTSAFLSLPPSRPTTSSWIFMPSVFSKDSTTNIDLPNFDSLLVKGSYPTSAPIHLCLSHIAELGTGRGAVILTPSKERLQGALLAENDPWLQRNSGTGTVAALSRCINILSVLLPPHSVRTGL